MNSPKHQIGPFSAAMVVAASMIGVGVFTTSGFAMAALGSPALVMAAWGVGALISICGAIGYSALAAKFCESGGEYLFLARAIHPAAGLTAGGVSLLAGFTGPIAAAALGLEAYAGNAVASAGLAVPRGGIAIAVILGAAALHTVSVHQAARLQNAVVMVKLLLIGGFIFYGLSHWSHFEGFSSSLSTESEFSLPVFAGQLVWISFSFAGFNAAIYLAEEIRDPAKSVPKAIIGGTLLVSAIYLLLNFIFVMAPTRSAIIADESIAEVAATAAVAVGGSSLAGLVRLVIVVGLATSVSAMVMTGPRVYAKMADDGFLPAFFSAQQKSPVVAIWCQALLAVVVVLFTGLKDLLGYLGFTLSICSALTVASLFVLRARGQVDRLPLGGFPVVLFVGATLVLGVIASKEQPLQAIAAVATLLVGLILFPLVQSKERTAD